MKKTSGPAWDNSCEYPSLESKEFNQDLERVKELNQKIEELATPFEALLPKADTLTVENSMEEIKNLQQIGVWRDELESLLWNLFTFVGCERSVDGSNEVAQSLEEKLRMVSSSIRKTLAPCDQFLILIKPELVEKYLDHPVTKAESFLVSHDRLRRDYMLPLEQEKLIMELGVSSYQPWGTLYNNITSSMRCELETEDGKVTKGLAATNSMLSDSSEEERKKAFLALKESWEQQTIPCAAILNSIAGWRHSIYQKRSHTRKMDFMNPPLHNNRIQSATLDSMMKVVDEGKALGQKANLLCAKTLGKDALEPWDLGAPPPFLADDNSAIPFEEGVNIVRSAFAKVHPSMGEFVDTMVKNKWIEARVLDTKRPGAYCTRFAKSRTPRVYQTYSGSLSNIKTLAHELGHAYHGWVMKELPLAQTSYPMCFAETASIFAESLLNDELPNVMKDPKTHLLIGWNDVKQISTFLLNIPARLDFEKEFYSRRENGPVPLSEISTLMKESLENRYGNSLTEVDTLFWANKLHFYKTGISFYNFPYTFGYLFSLGVFQMYKEQGDQFHEKYKNLLLDSGSMVLEDLAQKHLGVDITETTFWQKSLKILENQLNGFEKAISE